MPSASALADGNASPAQWTPDLFPSYVQRFEATFGAPQEAAESTCSVANLPGDAELAFGCRWDDTTASHAKKAEMMNRAGVKATFYFCANSSPFFATGPRALMAGGHAIGNHTCGHPVLPAISPNAAFRAIAVNRVILETNIQHTVMSFVSPFGWGSNPVDPECMPSIASSIVATGHFVTQDNPTSWKGSQSPESYMPTWRFSAGDRNPSRELFVKGWTAMKNAALASPEIPRLGLGTHSWCNDAGNDLQEALLKEYCLDPKWVQLNDWQYGAYRYEVLHGGVRKVSSSGNVATFEATRFFPAQIGDDMALSLKFSGAQPVSVRTKAGALAKGERGTWTLPHAAGARLHDRIACADGDGLTHDFPGLKVVVSPDEKDGVLHVRIENRTGRDLRRVCVAGAFPPKWSRRSGQATAKAVRSGDTFECALEMGRVWRRDYAFGAAYYPVSVDFSDDSGVFRVWCEATTPFVEVPASLPSRAARVWGPADATALAAADWHAASMPGAELPDAANWKSPGVSQDSLWYVVTGRLRSNESVCALAADPRQGRFVVYDFVSPEARTVCLRTSIEAKRRNATLYVNGEKLQYTGPKQNFEARKGANRVVLRADMKADSHYTDIVYLCVTGCDGLNEAL